MQKQPPYPESMNTRSGASWDHYFMRVAEVVASQCKCKSRQVGCVLVRDKIIISTGYNGPPRGFPHCEKCPRREKGFGSGEGLHLCPAAHAEMNCIASAARVGGTTADAVLYINDVVPCKSCLSVLVNAGVTEIVTKTPGFYDLLSRRIVKECKMTIRTLDT